MVAPVKPWAVEGPEDGPAILFVHGAIVSRGLWVDQVARLRDRYRCITVDLPGHGVLAGEAYSVTRAVEVLRDAIDEAAGGRAVVVGLSLGGYSSMALAGRHPERVRGLVIAGSSFEPAGLARVAFMAYGWFLTLVPERLMRRLLARVFLRAYGPAVAAEMVAGYQLRGGGRAVRTLPRESFRSLLLAYGGPILVINGDLDVVFRFGEAAFVRGIPGLTVKRLRRASHVSNLDQPEAFATAVATFVAGLPEEAGWYPRPTSPPPSERLDARP
jgi:pimeloyl-ACP methyl ester carboxylesterase